MGRCVVQQHTMADIVDGSFIDMAVLWDGSGWDVGNGWLIADQKYPDHTYETTSNAHGFFVRTRYAGEWVQS